MINASDVFKQNITQFGKEIAIKIAYDDVTIVNSGIKSLTLTKKDDLFKSSMRAIDIILDGNVDLRGKELFIDFGVSFEDSEYEYVHFGTFIPYADSINYSYEKNETSLTCYDNLIKTHVTYDLKLNVSENGITTDTLLKAICSHFSFLFTNNTSYVNRTSIITKENYNLMLNLKPTYRDVLDYIAQITASLIVVDDNELKLVYPKKTDFVFDGSNLKTLNVSDRLGPFNRVSFTRTEIKRVTDEEGEISEEEDEVTYFREDSDSIQANGKSEISFGNNPLINNSLLDAIFNKIKGFIYYSYDISSFGFCYFNPLEIVKIEYAENEYTSVIMNDIITINNGLNESLYAEKESSSADDYIATSGIQKDVNYSNANYKEIYSEKFRGIRADFQNVTADIINITKELNATKATIEDLDVGNLKADVALLKDTQIGIADVETLLAEKSYLNEAQVNTLVASKGYITEANIDTLISNNVSVNYAKIDFSNVNSEHVNNLFVKSGVFEEVTGEEGILYEMKSVKFDGDLIKANTIIADSLIITGEDGLYYRMNAEGGHLTEEQLTDEVYKKYLDGTNIVANSITADKIDVKKLSALSSDLGDITGGSLNINDRFIVNSVGSMKAVSGEFSGTINADSGTIGGFDINNVSISSNLDDTVYQIDKGLVDELDGSYTNTYHHRAIRFSINRHQDTYLEQGDNVKVISLKYADWTTEKGVTSDGETFETTISSLQIPYEEKFYLTYGGLLYTSNIKATGGNIGGWTLKSDQLYKTKEDDDGYITESYISSSGSGSLLFSRFSSNEDNESHYLHIDREGLTIQGESYDDNEEFHLQVYEHGFSIDRGKYASAFTDNGIYMSREISTSIRNANLIIDNSGEFIIDVYNGNYKESIYTKVGGRKRTLFTLYEGDDTGDGLIIPSLGGFTIIGSGESASAYYNGVGWNGQDENMAITGDNNVNIITNLQNGYDSRKRFVFLKDGNMRIDGGIYTGYKTSSTDGLIGVIAASTGNLHLTGSGGPSIYFYYANATSSTHTLQARENDFYMNKQLTATGNIISTGGSNIQLYRGSNTYGAGMWTDRTNYAAFYLYNEDGWVSRMAIYPTTFNFNKQVQVVGAVVLTNSNALWVKDTNGTNKQVCGISSANNLFIGSATTAGTDGDTNIYGDNYINFLANRSSSSYKAGQLQLFREQSDSHRTIIRPATNSGIYLGTTTYRFNTAFFTNAITASDLKEKDIIEDFDFKVKDFIMGLEPIAYRRTGEGDTGNRIHIGLGAQTLAKHIKDLNLGNLSMVQASIIDGENERVYNGEEIDDNILSWGINYTELIPYTVLIEQDHERRIRYLEEENEQLKQILKKNNLLGEIA